MSNYLRIISKPFNDHNQYRCRCLFFRNPPYALLQIFPTLSKCAHKNLSQNHLSSQ